MCYKIISGFSDIPSSKILQFAFTRSRRAHQFQLGRCCSTNNILYNFWFRVVRVWNPLPADIVKCPLTYTVLLWKLLFAVRIHILLYVFPVRDFAVNKSTRHGWKDFPTWSECSTLSPLLLPHLNHLLSWLRHPSSPPQLPSRQKPYTIRVSNRSNSRISSVSICNGGWIFVLHLQRNGAQYNLKCLPILCAPISLSIEECAHLQRWMLLTRLAIYQ